MADFMKARQTTEDVATCLDLIVSGAPYVWSDFTDVPIVDAALDAIRVRALALEATHPCTDGTAYLNAEGLDILKEIARALRQGRAPTGSEQGK